MSDKNLYENEDPMWQTHMQTLTKRKKSLGIYQIINDILLEYYSDRGMAVPNWEYRKDPQWWTDYLKALQEDGV